MHPIHCRHGNAFHSSTCRTLRSLYNQPLSWKLRRVNCLFKPVFKIVLFKYGFPPSVLTHPRFASLTSSHPPDLCSLSPSLSYQTSSSLQIYEGLVYMDFSKDIMDAQGYGVSRDHCDKSCDHHVVMCQVYTRMVTQMLG